ncbi:MAG: hypothetical protein ACC619_01805 [Paracoccaceae bacterium]
MSDDVWLAVLSRISADAPVDLDHEVFSSDPKDGQKAICFSSLRDGKAPNPPSAKLWDSRSPVRSYLGVRVDTVPSDITPAAIRLAAAALERNIIPVILTTLADSGFERFGFRVERIMGETKVERAAFEEELKRFWGMAIVIDVGDVAALS